MYQKDIEINKTFSLALQNHQKNNLKIAEKLYKKILISNPNNADVNNNLGIIYKEFGQFDKAINFYERAIAIHSNHPDAHNNLGLLLKELGEYKKAIKCYENAIEINPNNASALNNLGLVYRQLKEHKKAVQFYEEAIKIKPDLSVIYSNLGLAYKEMGEIQKTINCYQEVAKREPENLVNYYFLSELKTDILNLNFKEKIQKIIKNKNCSKINISYGNFLLSKYESNNKNYKKEFSYLNKAHQYFFQTREKKFKILVKYWLNELPKKYNSINGTDTKKKNEKVNSNINPIFIVGVPRSGSTLIEQIIASSDKNIPIGEETEIINFFVKQIFKKKTSKNDMEDIKKRILNEYYEKKLLKKENNLVFTDKSLDNFFYLGLIKEIFPNAKIVNCKRQPLSCIISMLKNNLTGISWAHNLKYIFKYLDNYYRIVKNFKKQFSDSIYELEFEKFVNNPEREAKKLLQFCNLPWSPSCLEFYKRKDIISQTASNMQIKKPVYKDLSSKYLPYKKLLLKYSKKYDWFD